MIENILYMVAGGAIAVVLGAISPSAPAIQKEISDLFKEDNTERTGCQVLQGLNARRKEQGKRQLRMGSLYRVLDSLVELEVLSIKYKKDNNNTRRRHYFIS